ncbi:MAG: FAD-dependent oxidoreductase [Candidatus Dormibacteria bacterium]
MPALPRSRPFSAEGRRANLEDMAARRLDVLVVGGGISGAGVALEARRRGYDVALVEARDFASGTSSRSSKLVHGGIRYLGQGEVGLVHEALQERRRLRQMFPDLVQPLPFLMPIPSARSQAAMLAAGFWMYDALSVGSGFERHRRVSAAEAIHQAPALQASAIRGAWKYWDARTDDARLTIEVLRRAATRGALAANYAPLRSAERRDGWWRAEVADELTGSILTVTTRYIVNASGVWAEEVGALAGRADAEIRPSKGIHLTVSAADLPIRVALAFPVGDGRMLFAIPWHGYVVVGTTDDDYHGDIAHPQCSPAEAAELLRGVNQFFHLELGPGAVLSRWAGVRPLVAKGGSDSKTKDLSRRPFINLAPDGLLTLTGGKLTTFVRMAVDAVDLLPGPRAAAPESEPLPAPPESRADAPYLPGAAGYTLADIERACDHEMAITLEDALIRRTRLAFLDTRAASDAAAPVAQLMAQRLGWESAAPQLAQFAHCLERDFGHAAGVGLAAPGRRNSQRPTERNSA